MAKPGQLKDNKNAALKPGQMRRVQITVSLSGDQLQRFVRSLNIDPAMSDAMSEQELRELVAKAAREKIDQLFDAL